MLETKLSAEHLAQIRQNQAIYGMKKTVELGQVNATSTVFSILGKDNVLNLLRRHMRKDWGDIDELDWYQNEQALLMGERVISSYRIENETVFVITGSDRSYTTIMMAYEY
ncbi:type I restriction endonuclease subunit M [Ursidibacter maritimus]|uniref:Type I restriction endonuclease subunit M n=1 Tax=Ursidibacter maritimus TaxID=1331689 RepID=A0A949T368_9PAST|nr:type I restriction endonuclease subunit M [Ursidibacter maritimus]KAE9541348.1 hypothetical protein A1D26_00070 [Ursidibacter maritimus]MBV6524455.1 type I restriction endonuclease subunit M [Ursidibacter maritimus]MBV6526509.1 type I restriction endonuclease subunit M [Ursidibacter maritimus]MBV6527087.1 type I restriction endonuclease subunit M [Ursidibacter maritimus]MBV6530396.1 type I restriction endonuclease subunit M [Ursidibacter maritimus]